MGKKSKVRISRRDEKATKNSSHGERVSWELRESAPGIVLYDRVGVSSQEILEQTMMENTNMANYVKRDGFRCRQTLAQSFVNKALSFSHLTKDLQDIYSLRQRGPRQKMTCAIGIQH